MEGKGGTVLCRGFQREVGRSRDLWAQQGAARLCAERACLQRPIIFFDELEKLIKICTSGEAERKGRESRERCVVGRGGGRMPLFLATPISCWAYV